METISYALILYGMLDANRNAQVFATMLLGITSEP